MDDFLVKDVSGEVIQADVESLDRSWHAAQVWFFKDKRFVRRVLTTGEGNKRAETLLVYDFEG